MTIRLLLLAAALISLSSAQESPCTGHLVTIEPNGAASGGSKDRLRAAVQHGLPIRVGWILGPHGELTHWADATFLSVFEGEVFAQIPTIQQQTPVRGKARIELPKTGGRWTGLLGTDGRLEGHFDNGSEAPETRVRSIWCIDPRVAKEEAQR